MNFNLFVITILARNIDKGVNAVAELKKLGLNANFYQCDIENLESLNNLSHYLKEKYGGIDILVNNAAIHIRVI